MSVSFDAIRNAVANQGRVSEGFGSATGKVTQVAKSIGQAVHGVMPVTNNKLDSRTEQFVAAIEILNVQVDHLYNLFGMQKPEITQEQLQAMVVDRMRAIRDGESNRKQSPAPQPVTRAPQPSPVRPVAQVMQEYVEQEEPVIEAPVESQQPVGPRQLPTGPDEAWA